MAQTLDKIRGCRGSDIWSSTMRCSAAAFVLWVASCGNVANINQATVLDRVETIGDPSGFERVGDIELVDKEAGVRRYEGGYLLTWRADGAAPGDVLDALMPVLNQVGYVPEPIAETMCTSEALSVFLLHEPTWLGSARLSFDTEEGVIRFLASWDSRSQGLETGPLGDLPSC